MKKFTQLFLALLFCLSGKSFCQTISTYAGNNSRGYSGDGGQATAGSITASYNVAADSKGNLYICDYDNSVIRKVSAAGIITTFAGTGTVGYSGDGGAATAATISHAISVAVDPIGNVLFIDFNNTVVRKVDTFGIITTIAGTSGRGYSGDGGAATAATFLYPTGIAIDLSGNIFIADDMNSVVRKINTSGIITTVAGNGATGYSGDGGQATAAELNDPRSVAVDGSGNLFIVDLTGEVLRKVNSSGIISTLAGDYLTTGYTAGGGVATAAILNNPHGVAVDHYGNVYISEENNQVVRKINSSGIFSTIAGTDTTTGYTGDGGLATAATLDHPFGLAFDDTGNLYIADHANYVIRKVTPGSSSPYFTMGTSHALVLCENSGSYSINSLLAVNDPISGLTDTWSAIHSPAHGTLIVSFSTTTTGGTITPTGLSYNPTTGYSGNDTFGVQVSDGTHTASILIYVTVNPLPSLITGASSLMASSSTTYSDSVTGGVWTTASSGIASVNSGSGLVTGVAAGSTIITYTLPAGCYRTHGITIIPYVAHIAGTLTLCAGNSTTLTDSSSGGVWTSSNTGVATIGSSTGIVASVGAGTTIISYTLTGGSVATATITVNSIPGAITGASLVCAGASTTLIDGTSGGSWHSSNTVVATIGSGTGSVTGVSGGTVIITYTLGTGCYTTKVETVSAVAAITGSTSVCTSSTITLSDGTTGGTWTSSTAGVATIGTSGIVTGVSAGTDIISYTLSTGCWSTFVITVNPSPSAGAISGGVSVSTGSNITLTDGVTGGVWHSSNTTIASVGSGTGVVSGVSTGTVIISYGVTNSCGTAYATHSVTVIFSLAAITGTTGFCQGATTTLSDATLGGTWNSSNTAIATIGSTGIVTGVSAGTATISYIESGSSVTTIVTVNPLPASITGSSSVCTGNTITFTDGTTGGIWSLGSSAIATIGTSGIVTGVSAGSAIVTYVLSTGCLTTKSINVSSVPPITGLSSVAVGYSITLSDLQTGGVWTSSNTGVATAGSSTGIVIGAAAGTAIITYSVTAGCGAVILTFPVTVYTLPGISLGANPSICMGDTSTSITYSGITGGASEYSIIWSALASAEGFKNTPAIISSIDTSISGGSYGAVSSIITDATGNIYYSEVYNNKVKKLSSSGVITTIAGNGAAGYSGDGGAATNAKLYSPCGLALDASGNLYIADLNNNLIRMVSSSGIITTKAGISANSGNSGDGGPATAAAIGRPAAIALDGSGNIYFSDNFNSVIRKINSSGIISRVAGTGTNGYSGDGGAATAATLSGPNGIQFDNNGNLIIADVSNNVVRKVNTSGIISTIAGTGTAGFNGDGGPATLAKLYSPISVTIDAFGNLFIADEGNNEIREVNTAGVISTFAGGGGGISYLYLGGTPRPGYSGDGGPATASELRDPLAIAAGTPGNIYIADGNNVIRKITNEAALTSSPIAIPVTDISVPGTFAGYFTVYNGSLYTTDTISVTVTPNSGTITGSNYLVCVGSSITFSETTTGGSWSSSNTGIATVSGGIVSGVSSGTALISYSVTGSCTPPATVTVTVTPLPAMTLGSIPTICAGDTTAWLTYTGLTGGIYSLTWSDSALAHGFLGSPAIITTIAGTGVGAGFGTGGYTGDGGAATAADLYYPYSIAVDGGGTIYFSDEYNNVIRKITPAGIISTIAGNGTAGYSGDGGPATAGQLNDPRQVALDAEGNIYVAEYENAVVRKISTTGIITTVAGSHFLGYSGDGGPATVAQINAVGVTVDLAGNIYVSDWLSNTIRKVNTSGIITRFAGTGGVAGYTGDGGQATAATINDPGGVYADVSGNIFITDYANNVIRKVNTSGVITTVAGNGTAGYSGDGGSATAAELNLPSEISVDAAGNIFIADESNEVIRKVNASGIINTVAGNGSNGYTGDGGQATAATMTFPTGVATDVTGNIYFADIINNVIRKVSTELPVPSSPLGLSVPPLVAPGTYSGDITIFSGSCSSSYSMSVTVSPSAGFISGPSGICLGSSVTLTDFTSGGSWTSSNTSAATVSGGVVDGITSGTAIISYSISGLGACSVATHVINVYPAPSAITGATSFCIPSTTTLTDGVSGGWWTSSNSTVATVDSFSGLVTGIGNGNVIISYILGGGCFTTATVTVSTSAMPPLYGPSGICTGSSGLLTDAATGGAWYSSNTAVATISGGLVTGISAGTTLISYVVSTSCGLQSTSEIVTVGVSPSLLLGSNPIVCAGDTNASFTYTGLSGTPFYNIIWNDTALSKGFKNKPLIITTAAGNYSLGGSYSGDGGPATAAGLSYPAATVFDANGNMYISDFFNHVVRKVNPSGIITTYAGNGTLGYSGDGGAATAASMFFPGALAIDGAGNLFITDVNNQVIRKVDASGIISTYAGVYADPGYSGDGGPASAALLNSPWGLATDGSGNLYIADANNNVIREVSVTGIISTFAGTGVAGYSGDGGPATAARLNGLLYLNRDVTGNFYFSDNADNIVRKIDASGIISTIAGNGTAGYSGDNGPASAAQLYNPDEVVPDAYGNVYIADGGNNVIREVNVFGAITTIAGGGAGIDLSGIPNAGYSGDGGVATAATLYVPEGLAIDGEGNLFVSDQNNVVRELSNIGPLPSSPVVFGVPAGAPAGTYSGYFNIYNGTCSVDYPVTVTIAPSSGEINGNSLVCTGSTITLNDTSSGGAWSSSNTSVATLSGGIVSGVSAGTAMVSYTVTSACGTRSATELVTVNPSPSLTLGSNPVICSGDSSALLGYTGLTGIPLYNIIWSDTALAQRFQNSTAYINTIAGSTTYSGTYSGDGGPATSAGLSYPYGMVKDIYGNLFIADAGNNVVRKITPSGVIITVAGTGVNGYSGDGGPATSAQLAEPISLAIDQLGNLFISDWGNNVVRKVDARGVISTFAGVYGNSIYSGDGVPATSANMFPVGITFDPANNLIIADMTNERIRKVNSAGIISTIGGNGTSGYTGDGGTATLATFAYPSYLSYDPSGNLYISDESNNVIRKINTSGIISTYAGTGTASYSGDYGPSTAATFNAPQGLASDAYGNLYIADQNNNVIRKINHLGVITTVAGGGSGVSGLYGSAVSGYAGDGGVAATSTLNNPAGLAVDNEGNLFISDQNNVVREVSNLSAIPSSPVSLTIPPSAAPGTYQGYLNVYNGTCFNSYPFSVKINNVAGTITGAGSVCIGSSIMLTDTTSGGTWASSNTAVATVTGGMVSGLSPGTATISYTVTGGCGTHSALFTVTVNATTFTAGAITGTGSVCQGSSITLTDTSGSGPGIWSSSNTAVATVSSGLVSGLAAGTTIISYTITGACGSAIATRIFTVNPLPNAGSISGTSSVCTGDYINLSDSVSGGAWTSSNSAKATVTSGVVTGVSTGTAIISYIVTNGCGMSYSTEIITINTIPSAGTISGSSVVGTGVTVTLSDSAPGGSWTVTNNHASISPGMVTGVSPGLDTVSYIVTNGCGTSTATFTISVITSLSPIAGITTLCAGSTTSLSDSGVGTWSSSNTSVATINAVSGLLTAVTAGTSIISYTGGGSYVTTTVTVNAAPGIMGGGAPSICQGSFTTFTNTVSGGIWSSSASTIAFAGSTGIVTGISAGSANITYTLPGGCFTTTSIIVNASPGVISGPASVCVGQNISLSNTTGGGVWSSASPTIATIGSGTGIVSGVAGGLTTSISYTIGSGCFATTVITVNALSAISGATSVCQGQSISLTDGASGGTWSSAATDVSVGSTSGTVTGISGGTALISYVLGSGCTTSTVITVNAIAPITGPASVCVGQTITLSDITGGGTWSSSAPTIASVGSTGIVTGVAAGTGVAISYNLGSGCSMGYSITVNALSAISGASSVCQGQSITLTDGASGGTWSSAATDVSVGSTSGTITGISGGTALISYVLSSGCTTSTVITVNAIAPITGPASVCVGQTITLIDITGGGTWSSSAPTMASVGSTGIVTGVAAGTGVAISYNLGSGCSVGYSMTVNGLSAISGVSSVCQGQSITLTDGASGGTWSSAAGDVSVGSTSGTITGISGGTALISYVLGSGCTTSTVITVNAIAPITGPASVCVGQTITLSDITGGGTWSSSSPTMASVGSTGIVTGVAAGTGVAISYNLGSGCSVGYSITVNALSAISGASSVCQGQSITLTDGASGGIWSSSAADVSVGSTSGTITGISGGTALISYVLSSGCTTSTVITVNAIAPITGPASVCVGQTITLSDITGGGTWSSSAPTLASVGSTGIVTGVAAGTGVAISYNLGSGCSVGYSMTVNGLSAISGASSVCQGLTTTLTDATSGGTWSSSNTSIATIGSGSGVVTGVAGGSAIISYLLPAGCMVTASITVNPVSAISGPVSVCVGQTITLSDLSGGGTWSSGAPTIATVGSSGIVTGIAGGLTANISYTLGSGCYAITTVTVNALSPVSGLVNVCPGQSITLTDATSGGLWSSSATGIATVGSATGTVSGVIAGTVIISYLLPSGCLSTASVTVGAMSPLTGPTVVCVGQTITLSDLTPGGSWLSSAPTIATVGSTGIVTGVAGNLTANITYSIGSTCRAITTVTVYPLQPISVSTTIPICVGTTNTATDPTSGGIWSTGSTAIAVIGTSGIITGVSAGTTLISYALGSGCTALYSITVNPLSPISGPGLICLHNTLTLTDPTPGGTWTSSSPTIISVVAGTGVTTANAANLTSTISYTLGTGCRATLAMSVVALPSAPASIGGPSSVSISGAPITLTDATTGGAWSSSNLAKATVGASTGIVTGVATGSVIITYTVTNAGGCTNNVTKNITIGPAPMPNSVTNNNTVTLNEGASLLLSEPEKGGVWGIAAGQDIAGINWETGLLTGLATGRATVNYTIINELGTTLSVTEVIVNPKPETTANLDISVCDLTLTPNPNKGEFTVKGSLGTATDGEIGLEVTDMLGQLVYRSKVKIINGKVNEHILLSDALANGMYLLNLQTAAGNKVLHFVLEQ